MKTNKTKNLKSEFNEKVARKDWDKALVVLEKMMRDSLSFFYKKGIILYHLKRYEEAMLVLSKVLDMEPENKDAQSMMRKCEKKIQAKQKTHSRFMKESCDSDNKELNDDESYLMITSAETFYATDVNDTDDKKNLVVTQLHNQKIFGHYKILEELGRGGMGIVYKVYDTHLDRTVALKVLISGNMAHQKEIQRFLREAKTTAKFKHPNIVTLYEIGVYEGYNYFTMDFINGFLLRELISKNRLALEKAVEIMVKITQAVDYAHKQGIIHRDLKPENIMLEYKTLSPKIMDFGLAKFIHAQENLSNAHELMGTPAYISPEQAEGTLVDHTTDIYSLGVILYEILTQRVPFQGHTLSNILQQIFNEDPIAPRKLNPEIPTGLELICLKCLEKKPQKRYHSAELLAQDLQNYLTHKPIVAKPPSKIHLMRKFIAKHRFFIATICTILFFSFLWGGYTFLQWNDTEAQRKEAILENARMMLWQAHKSSMADSWRECGVFAGMTLELTKSFPNSEDIDKLRNEAKSYVNTSISQYGALWESRSFAIRAAKVVHHPHSSLLATALYNGDIYLWDLHSGQKVKVLKGHFGPITSIHFLDDNKLISSSYDATLRIWDIDKCTITAQITAHDDRIIDAVVAPNNAIMASFSYDQSIRIWNVENLQLRQKINEHAKEVNAIAFTPDSRVLASCSNDSTIRFWDVETGEEISKVTTNNVITTMIFLNQEQLLAYGNETMLLLDVKTNVQKTFAIDKDINCIIPSGEKECILAGKDGNIYLYNSEKHVVSETFPGHSKEIVDIDYNAKTKYIFSTSLDNTVRIWDATTGKELTKVEGHSDYVYALAFSPDGKVLASGSHDNTILFWDTTTGRLTKTITTQSEGVQCVKYSPDGKILASGSVDGIVRLWDTTSSTLLTKLEGHSEAVQYLTFNKDGSLLASSSEDKTIILWDIMTQQNIATLKGHEHIVTKICFNVAGTLLASASYDNTIKIWDVASKSLLHTLTGHSNVVFGLDFSPNDKLLASCSEDTTIKIWDVEKGKIIAQLLGHKDIVCDVKFHPNRKMLASCSEDKSIKLWDIKTYTLLKEIYGHKDIVVALDFSPDGKMLASSSEDQTVHLWDTTRQEIPYVIQKHDEEIYTICYSPDGKTLASGTGSSNIYLLDLETEQEVVLTGHEDRVRRVIFDKTGKRLISCASDATIRIWDVATGKQLHIMTGHEGEIYQICLNPTDNETLVSACSDHTIKVWNINTGKEIKTLIGHTDFVYAAEISPDGKIIASFGHDKIIGLWDLEKKLAWAKFEGHTAPGYWLQFNHTGSVLASCSVDETIRLWSIKEKREIKKLLADSNVACAVFSPDDKILATAFYNGNIILWELVTGTPIKKMKAHRGPIYSMSFSPDGKILASASEDRTIRFWNMEPQNLITVSTAKITKSIELQFSQWRELNYTRTSSFNYRLDIPGNFIEVALEMNPKLITQILFSLKVVGNFDTEESLVPPSLFGVD